MSLDSIIFISFLITNIVLGLYSSFGITTIREYAVGNRNFSTATIAATLIATWMAGSNFSITVTETYKQGLYYIIPGLADGISFFIIAYLYAPRMLEFLGNLSVAEAMGNLYGRNVRIITAISSVVIGIGNIAVQFSVLSILLNNFLGISSFYAVVVSCLIIILYSSFGGIKAITFTDMIQFFTFGLIIPITAFLIWQSFSNTEAVFDTIAHNPIFNYKEFFSYRNPNFLNTLFLFLFFIIPSLDPVIFQRISMAKDTKQISSAFKIAGFGMIFIEYGMIAFIGVLLLAGGISLDLNSPETYILEYMPYGFKGLFVVGITAMVMSTADSYINSSSISLINDLGGSLGLKLSPGKLLFLVRISAAIIGSVALLISLFSKNLLDLILSTYSFYMPIVSVPLILAIFGFRTSSRSVLIGITSGFLSVILFKILVTQINPIIPGMIINITFLFGSHYILKQSGGWVGIREKEPLNILRLERKQKIQRFKNFLFNFNLIIFCKKNAPEDEKNYVYFGLFCLLFILSTIYSLPTELNKKYFELITFLYCSILVIATIFITYPIWLKKFKNSNIISLIWVFATSYCLVFASSLIAALSNFDSMQLTIMISSLVTMAILSRWRLAMVMILGGTALSIKFYKWYAKVETLQQTSDSLQFKIVYCLLLTSSILIAFLKPKQEKQELVEEKAKHLTGTINYKDDELQKALMLKNEFIRNVTHEYHAPMTGIINNAEALIDNYDFLDDQARKKAIETIYKSAVRLESFDANIRDLARLSNSEAEIDITKTNLSDLVFERFDICKKLYVNSIKQSDYQFILNIENNIIVDCDKYYLEQTLDNLIINAFTYCTKGKIRIRLVKKNNQAKFSITDQGIGIPKEELYDIFGSFTVSSKTRTPAGGRGVGLALCKKVIEMHKGIIQAESTAGETTFTFEIPIVFDEITKLFSKEIVEVAKNLLKKGIDIKLIAESTHMRESQIKALKEES